jgi:hypothetical protein
MRLQLLISTIFERGERGEDARGGLLGGEEERGVGGHSLDTVETVQVFVEHDLEDRDGSLTARRALMASPGVGNREDSPRGDDGRGEEVEPRLNGSLQS